MDTAAGGDYDRAVRAASLLAAALAAVVVAAPAALAGGGTTTLKATLTGGYLHTTSPRRWNRDDHDLADQGLLEVQLPRH